MFLNKVLIVGNLTRDPEMRAIPSGVKVTQFSVATNSTYRDKNGEKIERVEFHNVVVFGKQAESAASYLKKGQNVLIEGRLQTRSWDDKAGVKKYRTEIVADRVQFGFRPGAKETVVDAETGEQTPPKGKQAAKTTKREPNGMPEGVDYPTEDINPDEIPFR